MSKVADFFKKHSWKNLTTRRKSFIIATIIVLVSLAAFLAFSPIGVLTQTSFSKTFGGNGERIVTVYNGNGDMIRHYRGNYAVETYNHHYSILNMDTKERTDIYGSMTIIIDEGPNVHTIEAKGDSNNE